MIIVCGRPGSGKTTLAGVLSRELRCPLISRDVLKEGYINTTEKGHAFITPEENVGIYNLFFATIELLLDNKITTIAESAFQHKLWSPKYENLSKKADIKIIICKIDNLLANRRFLDRKKNDPFRESFHGDDPDFITDEHYIYNPPGFQVPAMEVDTTGEYKPALSEIVSFLRGGKNKSGKI